MGQDLCNRQMAFAMGVKLGPDLGHGSLETGKIGSVIQNLHHDERRNRFGRGVDGDEGVRLPGSGFLAVLETAMEIDEAFIAAKHGKSCTKLIHRVEVVSKRIGNGAEPVRDMAGNRMCHGLEVAREGLRRQPRGGRGSFWTRATSFRPASVWSCHWTRAFA